jgi:hypothetical protein
VTADDTRDPGRLGEGAPPGHLPEDTGERRVAGFQRALRWVTWLTFLGLAVWNLQSVYFSPLEWVALAAAIGVSIWCLAKPLGGPKVELTEPQHLLGAFVSRTNWGLLLFGAILMIGGIGGGGAILYDMSTGRATFGDVLRDIAIFIEGWFAEIFTGGGYDAELEKTHAYAIVVLVIPGLLLVWYTLIPLLKRGSEFRVEYDGSITLRRGDNWPMLPEYEYSSVTADGTTITFTPASDGGARIVLPQMRVYSREYGCRLRSELSAKFFRQRLTGRGFTIDGPDEAKGSSFVARRT